MILTGNKIIDEVNKKRIVIDPFEVDNVDPNSYSFRINDEIIEYDLGENGYIDVRQNINYKKYKIPKEGFVLEPNKFYLGSTFEKMGSNYYAKTLLANLSTSSMGMWIQFSAPLGHVGAIINWTLEIKVAQKVKIYPFMKIGKLAFWDVLGDTNLYKGKYIGSQSVVHSRIIEDFKEKV